MTTVSNRRAIIAVVITLFAIATPSLPAFANPPKTIDDFTDASRWKVVASDGVELKCSESPEAAGEHSSTLRLDINFVTGAGYAGIRRELPLDLPPNFELGFSIRGDLPPNNLEFKLIDATGETVWWVNRRTFEFPHDWTRLTSRRRHFQFAWGPSDAPLTRAAAIEIVISSAQGGHGTIYLDDLTFRPLPESKKYEGTPTLSASSQASPEPRRRLHSTAIQKPNGSRPRTIVRPRSRSISALHANLAVLSSIGTQPHTPTNTRLSSRMTVKTGRPLEPSPPRLVAGNSSRFPILKREQSAWRCPLADDADHVAIRDIEVLPLDTSRDANAFAAEIAKRAPRGHYPRSILGEGLFWTVVGAPADDHEALFSEDGAAEVDHQAFSIEPFLYCDGQFHTWADATTTQSLAAGFAPVPTVTRAYDKLKLAITAAADGNRNNSSLLLNYTSRIPRPFQPRARSISRSVRCKSIRPINGSKRPAASRESTRSRSAILSALSTSTTE